MAFRLSGANLTLLTVALLAAGSSSLLPTMAQAKVGVTSATDGDPRGKPPAEAERVLRVGVDVQANELITTTANDRAHLMFLDGTSLSVGPNAQLTIDKFVYDPTTKTGDLAINASKGVFRLVGGKISKTNAITVTTPSSTIGIRGGISIFNVEQRSTTSVFVFGISMSVGAGGRLEVVTRPGFQVITMFGGLPGRPGAVPPGALSVALGQLEGGKSGGQQGGGADQSAQNSGFSNANSGQGSGNTLGNRFGSGPGPRNANPSNIVTNALSNAFETAPSNQPTAIVSKATSMQQTITYNGTMGGLVINNGNTSFGTGTYQQVWSTNTGTGNTTANFNNSTYSGTTNRVGNSGFQATMPTTNASTPGRTMNMNGAFVGQGTFPNNQAGTFTVNGPNYQAGGAFAGQKAP